MKRKRVTSPKRNRRKIKIIIDTNIVFSCLLNTNSAIGDLIFNSEGIFEFYSCSYMRIEIERHWGKLKRISKLSENHLRESCIKIFSKINFINEELIPEKTWLDAENICKQIDIDDTDFIALTKYMRGYLWTGDKELYNGLKVKKFKNIFKTTELAALRNL